MYLVFSLLKKDCKVIGVKWPIIKSSCTGGSIYHFHENLTLPADEEIAINKIRSHLQKEIQHSFSSVWIALKQTNKQKVWKNDPKDTKLFYEMGFTCKCISLILFPDPSDWREKFEMKKKSTN